MYMKTGTTKYPAELLIRRTTVILISVFLICFSSMVSAAGRHPVNKTWVATWGASPTAFMSFGNAAPPAPLDNQTIRQIVRISTGG